MPIGTPKTRSAIAPDITQNGRQNPRKANQQIGGNSTNFPPNDQLPDVLRGLNAMEEAKCGQSTNDIKEHKSLRNSLVS
jgi:hypothetical protein